ncbi:flavin-dependent dehydrogenase [Actinomadura pelletieri DSM 43383]|uniref:Flavin-dependent dehydrogenase n=1 Tax=Actinomadura pelletieri DSM 43383 TaxID=1120940 RepID=A0A495QT37_9ACTN|nr:flavin-dependent dehydrogenase [Actinomadura pelletieri DSM 43383]
MVVGGGPAGAAVAWQLATAGAAVTLVHDHRDRWRPVGQQLAGAARPVLRAMGVLDAVVAESAPVHEARSAWPGPEVDSRSAILNPFGPPLAVERSRLDALLRAAAGGAGARLVRDHVRNPADGQRAAVLVDATGSSRVLSRTRLRWTCLDRLRCALWKAAPADPAPQPWSLVEAAPDGWWYTAPDPAGDRLTVMKVGDLPGAEDRREPPEHTARRLGRRVLPATADYRVATVGYANPPWSSRLVAVGDAAVAVDPLSSSGVRNALRLAGPAAAAVLGLLDGDTGPAHQYARCVRAIVDEHLDQRGHFVMLTGGHGPFWEKRRRPAVRSGVDRPASGRVDH